MQIIKKIIVTIDKIILDFFIFATSFLINLMGVF